MGSVLTSSVRPDIAEPTLNTVVGIQVLEVLELRVSNFGCCVDESILGFLGPECPTGNIDWTIGSVMLGITATMVCLKL